MALKSETIGLSAFHIPREYDAEDLVGKGTYGVVCSAIVKQGEGRVEAGLNVAIKKVENACMPQHLNFSRRLLRELRILRGMTHENIVEIYSVYCDGPKDSFADVYVVSELMETDLTSILKSNQSLSEEHFQFFLYQILRGLKYIHSVGVIHRDIRPRTLLVNANCDLKICDFGMAHIKFDGATPVAPTTQYVCTRWYRAPEVLCSWTEYDASIDIWSTGCIFAEMIGGAPLFPGMSTQHQLQLYAQVLGTKMEAFAKMPNEKCKHFLGSLPHCPVRKFSEIIEGAGAKPSAPALEMVEKMVCFDPSQRVSVKDALALDFLEELHTEEDEPTGPPLDAKLFLFDSAEQTALPGVLRDEYTKEVLLYRPKFFEELQAAA